MTTTETTTRHSNNRTLAQIKFLDAQIDEACAWLDAEAVKPVRDEARMLEVAESVISANSTLEALRATLKPVAEPGERPAQSRTLSQARTRLDEILNESLAIMSRYTPDDDAFRFPHDSRTMTGVCLSNDHHMCGGRVLGSACGCETKCQCRCHKI